ncbi:MAG TPA: phosphoribosylamine--glycine ligase [Candidatus Latescibacteria bacterium]|jgi:phosphoribosylamine--glycine ligase|nr:phosphoribosylamine--glycine ligase [Gemmatimonadaceae bacterium]MDP6016225.1 phosphoribosylamine--glycine ligase [Candidatus Latescibacterota bacterium]HJP33331.1 phosphoribosylamine--glycine ligase [Candidatus Latescibacterota bacterium]
MKVLVVGKGAREHALAWKLSQSSRIEQLFAAPGSPGIADHARCLSDIRVDLDISQRPRLESEIIKLRDFATAEGIDLTVVGPEAALAAGIVDRFQEAGLTIFGPSEAAARIESDKTFSKELMATIGVPTAAHRSFDDSASASAYIREQGAPIVVKASGLAAGKGAIVCPTEEEAVAAVREILDDRVFGESGAQVVIEEFMEGEEASLFAICDGERYINLVTAQDHKAIGEGDTGPNTGGMGAYAPAPVMTAELIDRANREVTEPVLAEMKRRGAPYSGVLYVGLMLTAEGPKVVEFNCRFGDPEVQVVLPLLRSDLVDLCLASARGDLSQAEPVELETDGAAVCVVMASGGYPGDYETGHAIDGAASTDNVILFHSGTALDGDQLVTAGGRVLAVTATAADIPSAVRTAYSAIDGIHFDGAYWRRDIAYRALQREGAV